MASPSAPKTGRMKQVSKANPEDPLTDETLGGDIIPTFAVLGIPVLAMFLWTQGGDWSQIVPIAIVWYGSLGLQALIDKKRIQAFMAETEVDEYGSSGTFMRSLGNLGIAALVILPVIGIATTVGLT